MGILLYKIGKGFYNNKLDVNSGMTELQLINEECKGLDKNCSTRGKRILIIIGGFLESNYEFNNIVQLINESELAIFIVSDVISFEQELQLVLMNMCSVVLHQAANYKFKQIRVPQLYSGVPELFYKNALQVWTPQLNKQINKVFFGGTSVGRENDLERYKVNERNDIFDTLQKQVKQNGNVIDSRLPHNEYLQKLATYKFSLIFNKSDLYNITGWITTRIFECIALDVIPLIDYKYDAFNLLSFRGYSTNNLIVTDFNSLVNAMNCNFYPIHSVLKNMVETRIQSKNCDFKRIILGIVEGSI